MNCKPCGIKNRRAGAPSVGRGYSVAAPARLQQEHTGAGGQQQQRPERKETAVARLGKVRRGGRRGGRSRSRRGGRLDGGIGEPLEVVNGAHDGCGHRIHFGLEGNRPSALDGVQRRVKSGEVFVQRTVKPAGFINRLIDGSVIGRRSAARGGEGASLALCEQVAQQSVYGTIGKVLLALFLRGDSTIRDVALAVIAVCRSNVSTICTSKYAYLRIR